MKNFIVGWLAITCFLVAVVTILGGLYWGFCYLPVWCRWVFGGFIGVSIFFGQDIHDMGRDIRN